MWEYFCGCSICWLAYILQVFLLHFCPLRLYLWEFLGGRVTIFPIKHLHVLQPNIGEALWTQNYIHLNGKPGVVRFWGCKNSGARPKWGLCWKVLWGNKLYYSLTRVKIRQKFPSVPFEAGVFLVFPMKVLLLGILSLGSGFCFNLFPFMSLELVFWPPWCPLNTKFRHTRIITCPRKMLSLQNTPGSLN